LIFINPQGLGQQRQRRQCAHLQCDPVAYRRFARIRPASQAPSLNIRMFGRASMPQFGHCGSGETSLHASMSTSGAMAVAGQMAWQQGRVHCRKWIEPWHSTIPENPAR
jgi:hypothetical protein